MEVTDQFCEDLHRSLHEHGVINLTDVNSAACNTQSGAQMGLFARSEPRTPMKRSHATYCHCFPEQNCILGLCMLTSFTSVQTQLLVFSSEPLLKHLHSVLSFQMSGTNRCM